tara:strand:- start:1546 stop:2760 length:1215 start_codon:yes stop_codon:yes gene_type:complete
MGDRKWGLLPEEVIERLWEKEWRNPRALKARLKGQKTFPISISLKPPRGQEAAVGLRQYQHFVEAWRAFPNQSCVVWESRTFRQLSDQTLPARFLVNDIGALAELLGEEERSALAVWEARISRILAEPFAQEGAAQKELFDVLVDHLEVLDGFSENDLELLVKLIPQLKPGLGAGCYLRALPVVYVDTKFIEQNLRFVERLLDVQYQGSVTIAGGLLAWLNCLENPKGWLFVRPLCESSQAALGGLPILQMDTATLQNFELPASNILVVENVQSGLALPPLNNTIAVFGGGRNTSWLSATWLISKQVAYWGDIDSEGLGILSDARGRCSIINALMMDEKTVDKFSSRMVEEPDFVRAFPGNLKDHEFDLFCKLREGCFGKPRLEQERLSSDYILLNLARWAQTP